ncbi:MAG: hypothetical protein ABUL64_00540 [Singulisphaera sp.]
MRLRSAAWGFALGLVVGATLALIWLGPHPVEVAKAPGRIIPASTRHPMLILQDESQYRAPQTPREHLSEPATEDAPLRQFLPPAGGCQGAKPVPQVWQPREFNGATYYIVPLADGR